MSLPDLHPWALSISDATALQKKLGHELVLNGTIDPRLVAGIDCSFSKHGAKIFAAVILTDIMQNRILEIAEAAGETQFPYIPGYLSFREGPIVLEAFAKLREKPDAVIFDGQGIAHPRGLGLAAHIGLWLQIPTVGCAKSRLCGEFTEPDRQKGSRTPLILNGRPVGTVLRTKDNIKPVFVSPGHLIGINEAAELVLKSCRGYRLPEPTRLAHLQVTKMRQEQDREK